MFATSHITNTKHFGYISNQCPKRRLLSLSSPAPRRRCGMGKETSRTSNRNRNRNSSNSSKQQQAATGRACTASNTPWTKALPRPTRRRQGNLQVNPKASRMLPPYPAYKHCSKASKTPNASSPWLFSSPSSTIHPSSAKMLPSSNACGQARRPSF